MPTRIAPFTVAELMDADEIMILSTGSHCISVSHVDGKPVGGRDAALLDRLQSAYQAWVRPRNQPLRKDGFSHADCCHHRAAALRGCPPPFTPRARI